MVMPDLRAVGGMKERKRRADLAVGEKGLNFVVISVMNLVIILGGCFARTNALPCQLILYKGLWKESARGSVVDRLGAGSKESDVGLLVRDRLKLSPKFRVAWLVSSSGGRELGRRMWRSVR